MSRAAIHKYGLKFGPTSSTINYLLPGVKQEEANLLSLKQEEASYDYLCEQMKSVLDFKTHVSGEEDQTW